MGGSSYQLIHSRLGSTTRKWDCSAARLKGKKRSSPSSQFPSPSARLLPAVTPIVKPLLKPLTRKISRLAETLPWRDCFVKRPPIKPVLGHWWSCGNDGEQRRRRRSWIELNRAFLIPRQIDEGGAHDWGTGPVVHYPAHYPQDPYLRLSAARSHTRTVVRSARCASRCASKHTTQRAHPAFSLLPLKVGVLWVLTRFPFVFGESKELLSPQFDKLKLVGNKRGRVIRVMAFLSSLQFPFGKSHSPPATVPMMNIARNCFSSSPLNCNQSRWFRMMTK